MSRAFVLRAIYGLITVLAVLPVMEFPPPFVWSGAVSLFGATLAVALVDAYSDSIAEMLAHERGLSWDERREIIRDVRPVFVGAQAPTLLLLLSAIGFFSVGHAIDAT